MSLSMASAAFAAKEAFLIPRLVVIHGGLMRPAASFALVAASSSTTEAKTTTKTATTLDVSRAVAAIAFAAEEALLVPILVVTHAGVMAPATALAFVASFRASTKAHIGNVHTAKPKAVIVVIVVIVVVVVALVVVVVVVVAIMVTVTT